MEIDDFDGELAILVCRANQLSVTRYHRVLSARKYRPIVPIGFHSASLTVVSPSFSSSLLPSFFSSFPFLSSSSLAVLFPPLSFVLKHKIRFFPWIATARVARRHDRGDEHGTKITLSFHKIRILANDFSRVLSSDYATTTRTRRPARKARSGKSDG